MNLFLGNIVIKIILINSNHSYRITMISATVRVIIISLVISNNDSIYKYSLSLEIMTQWLARKGWLSLRCYSRHHTADAGSLRQARDTFTRVTNTCQWPLLWTAYKIGFGQEENRDAMRRWRHTNTISLAVIMWWLSNYVPKTNGN